MNKELKALERLKDNLDYDTYYQYDNKECLLIIETALKALEIIKEKPVVALVDYKYTYEEWLELVEERDKDLFENKEEYDLLKEVLL